MGITTGELFAQLLMAVTPTAVGQALNNLTAASTPNDWRAAVKANAVGEEQDVANTLANNLQTDLLLQALLQPVGAADATTPLGLVLKNRIWNIGLKTAGVLNGGWSTPPHPSGKNATTLFYTVAAFDET